MTAKVASHSLTPTSVYYKVNSATKRRSSGCRGKETTLTETANPNFPLFVTYHGDVVCNCSLFSARKNISQLFEGFKSNTGGNVREMEEMEK